jgi:hypothetical protein
MEITFNVIEDENFKIVKQQAVIKDESTVEKESFPKKIQPTLENKKGHEWFNGTSWGLN